MRSPLLTWLFYGHFWIALAALGLSWQSVYLAHGPAAREGAALWFVGLATLAVYTAHRSLSYRRANGQSRGRRYQLVARHPRVSYWIGGLATLGAVGLGVQLPYLTYLPLLLALPLTFFYLIPLFPGGPRLRDLPYLKVIWVALAWTLMTDLLPKFAAGPPVALAEAGLRFAFTLAIALVFDTRDVVLDRRQGVRTLAATAPHWNRRLAVSLLLGCGLASLLLYPLTLGGSLALAYWVGAGVAWRTRAIYGEDFYAVYVNGVLLLPPLFLWTVS